MAGQDGRAPAYLKQDLLKNGAGYSFFQVVRLLGCLDDRARADLDVSEQSRNVRIRPHLSLAFPEADVEKVSEKEESGDVSYEVIANFLGLYGPSSPLPTFYTEDLLDEASEDGTAVREFVDSLNHRLYLIFYECLQKYRPFYHLVENGRVPYKERLFCLGGFGDEKHVRDIPEPDELLRYLGLFSQRPRSASGLKTLLRDGLGYPIDIVSCVRRKAQIPEDQLLRLGVSGGVLGEDCVLGKELDDRMGRFRIEVGPLSAEQYRKFFPGSGSYNRLVLLTELYLQDPLEFEIRISMQEQQAQTVCLGNARWSSLGIDTWLYSGEEIGVTSTTFYPQSRGGIP